MITREIEWLKKNPFVWNRPGLYLSIDVCECSDGPDVRIRATTDIDTVKGRHAPSIDSAIASLLHGITCSIVSFAAQKDIDLTIVRELDGIWDLLRVLAAYQLRVQKALHVTAMTQVSTALH